MKVFSQLVSAQLENRTSDYSSGTRARIWMRTDTSPVVVKFDDGSAVRTLVTTDNTQTLTNKTWNGVAVGEIYGGTNQTTYTTGDILYASGANTLSKLAKGTNGQFLQIGASIPAWSTVAATLGVLTKTANYTITATDDLILADTTSAFTLTLPASTGGGKVYRVKKTTNDVNACTIARAGADTIQDVVTALTSTTLDTQGEELMIIDATSGVWQVINRRMPSLWIAYTPTYTGFGTVSSNSAFYRRVGDSIEVVAYVVTGTVSAAIASLTLPTGLAIDSAKIGIVNNSSNPGQVVGNFASMATGSVGAILTATSTSTSLVYFGDKTSTANSAAPQLGSTITTNSTQTTCKFTVPISGWKS